MKTVIFLILLFTNLYSSDNFIKAYVSENHLDFKELKYDDYKNVALKEFTIKFQIDFEKLKDETYYLQVVSDENSLMYSNVDYKVVNSYIFFRLDKNQNSEIILKYIYDKPKIAEFRWKYISEFEFEKILPYEGILYGLAYGIIFCAFLYYLIIYFSTKNSYFLYYSLMQFFVLLSLAIFVYFSYTAKFNEILIYILKIAQSLAFLFTLLFAKTVLNTKEKLPLLNKFLIFFILLNIVDLISILVRKEPIIYMNIPFYMAFLIPFIVGVFAILKKDFYAIFYTIGWFVVAFSLYIAQYNFLDISSIYIIHIGAPLESLIFSFALGYMLKNLVKEKNKREKLLIHQSKLASMGEMINNIAHQWRQPLTHLGFINMNFQLALEDEKIDKKYLLEKIDEVNSQLNFMSKTIDNFRDFYKINKEKENFLISIAVQKAIDIMKPIFDNLDINLEFEIKKDKELFAYENEYSQVVLNILTNAKDILLLRDIENAKIKIVLDVKDEISYLSIEDNAGGIEKESIDKIFEPYFTTKQKGSGIGLYMSKMIVETHFNGKLEVENQSLGARFLIKI